MLSKRLGLLIATTSYADPQLPAVPDGAAHLNDLVDVLRSPQIGGFSLTALIDPTVETVRSAIVDLLAGRQPDDLVLLYVVGHCIRQTADSLFIALRETTRLDLGNTALPAAFVQQQLRESAAKKQIIILDGLLGSIVTTKTPLDRDSPLSVGLNFCVPNRHQAILAASDYLSFCLAGEHYIAVRSAQPPVAESIVRGLRSRAADEKSDRHVTVNGLLNYLKYVGSVRQDEMRAGWISEVAGDLIVAVYPDEATDQPKERSAPEALTPVSAPAPGSSLINDNIRFTAYRPAILVPGKWRRMMVFTHLDEPSALIEIETRARQVLGADSYGSVIIGEHDKHRDIVESRFPTARESEITLVPEVPGIRFSPPRRTFSWTTGLRMREESFFIYAPLSLADKSARGQISVFFQQLLLAEIALDLRVANDPAFKEDSWAKGVDRRFRKVFASYSNHDEEVIEAMDQIQAIGNEYLRRVLRMRSGQQWSERSLAMIADADVFQLFWSRKAAQSAYVEKEWRHAIGLQREGFVRPVYWEIPMAEAPEPLRRLRFCFLPGIHAMTDGRKDPDGEAASAIDKQTSVDMPKTHAVVLPSKSPVSTKSKSGATGKSVGSAPQPLSNKTQLGKTNDLSSAKATSAASSQGKRTSTALALVPRSSDGAKVRQRRILKWGAIFGTVIAGCCFIFLAINMVSRSFLKARHPSTYSKVASPSATVGPQAVASPIEEAPVLATPTPTPTLTASPTEALATPTPSPPSELPSASPSVAPTSTASPEATDSESPTNRGGRHWHRRLHHRHSGSGVPQT
jgi:hypothetical protein